MGEAAESDSIATPVPRARLRDRLLAIVLDPANVLGVVLLLAFVVRAVWLDQPPGGLIWDEAYYVNAARVIDGLPVPPQEHYADAPPGIDPNAEHPPLGKVLIALSISVLGDGPLGWRLPSLVAGMVALFAFYGIVRGAGAGPWLAILALALLAFDNLTHVHGRIATLDILVLAPMLVGAWLASRGRWALAGIAIGIALLVKLTAVFAAVALVLLLILEVLGGRRDRALLGRTARRIAAFGVSLVVVWVVGLWALDLRFTTFTSPVDHVRHMLAYGANLDAADRSRGVGCSGSSEPWQWLINECQIGYFKVTENPTGDPNVTRTTVEFRGALNAFLAGRDAACARVRRLGRVASARPARHVGDDLGGRELPALRGAGAGLGPRHVPLLHAARGPGGRGGGRGVHHPCRAPTRRPLGLRGAVRGGRRRVLPVPDHPLTRR